MMASVVQEQKRRRKKVEIGIKVKSSLHPIRAPASRQFVATKPYANIPRGPVHDTIEAIRVAEIEIGKVAIIRSNLVKEAKTLTLSVSAGLKHPALDRILDRLRQATIQVATALKRRRLLYNDTSVKPFWLADTVYVLTLLDDTEFLIELKDQVDFIASNNPLLLAEPHPGFASAHFSKEPEVLKSNRLQPYYGDASDAEQELIIELRSIPPDTLAAFDAARQAKQLVSVSFVNNTSSTKSQAAPPTTRPYDHSALINLKTEALNIPPETKQRLTFLKREIERAYNRRDRASQRLQKLECECDHINKKLAFTACGNSTSPSFKMAVKIAKLRDQALAFENDRRTHAAIVFREEQDIERRSATCKQILANTSAIITSPQHVVTHRTECLPAPALSIHNIKLIDAPIESLQVPAEASPPSESRPKEVPQQDTESCWTPPDSLRSYVSAGRNLIHVRQAALRALRQLAKRTVVSDKLRVHGRRALACGALRAYAQRAAIDYDRFVLQPYYKSITPLKVLTEEDENTI